MQTFDGALLVTMVTGQSVLFLSATLSTFYPEPQLHISTLNDGHVEVLVMSEGGYPSPALQWLMGNTSDVTNSTYTQLRQDQYTPLYSVNSKLNLTFSANSSIIFIMKNPDLSQEIRRNINLSLENSGHDGHKLKITSLFLLVLVTTTDFIFYVLYCLKIYNHTLEIAQMVIWFLSGFLPRNI